MLRPTGNTAAMNVLFTALLSEGSIIDLDGTIWIQLGLFAVAFFVFRPLIFRPMVALFEAREKAIEGSKLEALRLQDEVAAESVLTHEGEIKHGPTREAVEGAQS